MVLRQNRRNFLTALGSAGATGFLGAGRASAQAAPPETTTVRMATKAGSTCVAPQYVAEELLRQEGFTDIQFLASDAGPKQAKAIANTTSGRVMVVMRL